jgi:hypothetical protein
LQGSIETKLQGEKMRKFGLILAALMMFAAAGVQAQVAAPRLNSFFAAGNPAVLPLNASSQAGLGYLSLDAEFTAGGATFTAASGTGTGVNLRFVGESFAVAYGQITSDLDVEPILGSGTITIEESTLEIGVRLGDTFTLGVSQQTGSESEPGESEETSLVNAGIVWKLGDVVYLGGSYGTETGERTDPFNVDSESDHTVSRYGAALYSRDGESGYHIELNRKETSILELTDPGGNTQYLESLEETGFTLEVIFSNFLIGYESITIAQETADINNLFTVETTDIKEQVISLGWVPEEGLNIILVSLVSEETDEIGDVFTLTASAVQVSWAF